MQTDVNPEKLPENLPDRRRHPRYRFSIPLTIRSNDGTAIPGISMEISESGLSAITADSLKINDTVELEPIAGSRVSALVRRCIGRVYGFEFLNLTAEQAERITQSCKLLARYQGNKLGI
jgi:hypothetical protein